MLRRVLGYAAVAALIFALAGCGLFQRPQRPAWRDQAEKICLAEKRVTFSEYIRPQPAIEGPGICGLTQPLKVAALANGTVELKAAQTIGCPLTAALEQWLAEVLQPVAMARFGQPVARISAMGAYSCRPIDNIAGAKLSEHAFGNAMDIGGFTLADGRDIVIVKEWNGRDPQMRAFLREAHAGACNYFTTVLAPGSDAYHYNHIHVDLAAHGSTRTGLRRYCKPTPEPQLLPAPRKDDGLPEAPDLEEELDVAHNHRGLPPSARSAVAMGSLNLATPPDPSRVPNATRIARAPPLSSSTQSRTPTQPGVRRTATIRDDGAFDPGEVGD